jgi:16S rRNA (uracil1498-N3)-methyltransferase
MIRLFVPDPLAEGGRLALADGQARYLTTVMRRRVGEALAIFNGRDGEWRAVIAEAGKRGCTLAVETRLRPQTIGADLDLVVALVKRARLETIVEKAAELGARRVRLVITQHTNADHTNVERLTAIAIEASEQTGRLDAPKILPPERLGAVLDGWESGRTLVFCDEGGAAAPMLHAPLGEGPAGILIGPEGGFSEDERSRLRSSPFVVPAGLGPRILRADTAAIAALAIWQSLAGDWRARLTP